MTKYPSPHAEIEEHHMGFWITLYKSAQNPAGRQSRLDRELAAVLQAFAPLLRDARTGTGSDAIAALGVVSSDTRFQSVAIAIMKNSQDFRELMTLLD
jgi:hypothetical protein